MPPPMMTLSHFSKRASSTVIFEDTFDPPTIAAIGFSPLVIAPSRYSNSLARRNPETLGDKNLVTPSVDACARCAVPKASFTNMSNGAANFSTKPGSFFCFFLVKSSIFQHSNTSFCSRTNNLCNLITNAVRGKSYRRTQKSDIRSAQGPSENLSSGPSLGRPKWEHTVTTAPFSTRYCIVGIDIRMRVSSVIVLPSSGTFTSHLTKTFLPLSSASERSPTDFLASSSKTDREG